MAWRLLVATDGSASAGLAARLAGQLVGDGLVHLLHGVSAAPFAPLAALDSVSNLVSGSPGSLATEWELAREKEGVAMLERARADVVAVAPAARIESEQLVGRPGDSILACAEEGKFDLVLLGAHGHGALARAILGSVGAEVLQHALQPVLFARAGEIARVVVGVDGSSSSLNAARFARLVALRTGARVHLVYAAELAPDSYVAGRAEVERAFHDEAARAFAGARAELRLVGVTEELVFHEPAHALVERGRERELVVVGRRGRSDAARLLLGSVSRRVAFHARASVLVVP